MATRRSGPNIDFTGRRRRRKRRLNRTLAVGAALVVGLGGFYLLSRGGGLPSPFSKKPERPKFEFRLTSVKGYQLGPRKPSKKATERAARDIRHDLSEFYIDAFLAPQTWEEGVPEETWEIFAPAARRQAQRQSSSLTLGRVARSVTALRTTGSTLAVRVLFDSGGRPQAATAVALFKGNGQLRGGRRFGVSNRGGYVLRPGKDGWLIVGYPRVRTAIQPARGSQGGGASP